MIIINGTINHKLNPCGANCSALRATCNTSTASAVEHGIPCCIQPKNYEGVAAPAIQQWLPLQAWMKGNFLQHHSCVREDPDRKMNVFRSLSLGNLLFGYMENWMLIELVCLGFHFSYLHEGWGRGFSQPTKGWHCSRETSFCPSTICSSSDINPAAWHVAAGCRSPAMISWGG